MRSEDNSLDWLDISPRHRAWFAGWLCNGTYSAALYRGDRRLAKRLPKLHPAKQLDALTKLGDQCGPRFSREALLRDLEFTLANTGPDAPKKPRCRRGRPAALRNWKRELMDWQIRRDLLRASPWQTCRAAARRSIDKLGHDLCAEFYPGTAPTAISCRFALRCVLAKFSADQESAGYLSTKTGPAPVWEKGLLDDVMQCCQETNGPRRLAEFLAHKLRYGGKLPDGASESLRTINRALTRDRALAQALRCLAGDAKKRPRKGWVHLRNALEAALEFFLIPGAESENLFDFHLTHHRELQSHNWPRKSQQILR